MTFIKFWSAKVVANPNLEQSDTKVTISVSSLKNELEKAYRAGIEDEKAKNKAANDFKNVGKTNKNDITDLFKGIFGNDY